MIPPILVYYLKFYYLKNMKKGVWQQKDINKHNVVSDHDARNMKRCED